MIVITTKRGAYNQRFKMVVSSNFTLEEKPDLYYYDRIAPSDFIDVEKFLFENGFYNSSINNTTTRPDISPVVEILARQKAGIISSEEAASQINELRKQDVRRDLDKYLYREALRQQHFLSIGGGTSNLAYQFSFGYNTSLNNIQGSKPDDQYTIYANTSYKPIQNLSIQTGIIFTQGFTKSFTPNLPTLWPYLRLADENGLPLPIPHQYRQGYIDTAGAG